MEMACPIHMSIRTGVPRYLHCNDEYIQLHRVAAQVRNHVRFPAPSVLCRRRQCYRPEPETRNPTFPEPKPLIPLDPLVACKCLCSCSHIFTLLNGA